MSNHQIKRKLHKMFREVFPGAGVFIKRGEYYWTVGNGLLVRTWMVHISLRGELLVVVESVYWKELCWDTLDFVSTCTKRYSEQSGKLIETMKYQKLLEKRR